MNPNRALLIAIPVILAFVVLLTYLRLFSSTVVIVVIFALYIVVSLLNRRKFKKQGAAQGRPSQK